MKSLKKFLLITAVMAMMFALVTINASAYDVYIGNTTSDFTDEDEIRDLSAYVTGNTGKITFDPSSKTLTLENATIDTTSDGVCFMDLTGDITIVIKGTCKINADVTGIYSEEGSTLTIVGEDNASLEVNSVTAYGIVADGTQNLVIKNLDLTINSTSNNGIYVVDGNTTINNSKLNIASFGSGVRADGTLTVKNSTIANTITSSGTFEEAALEISENITIENSKITSTGSYFGIFSEKNIEIKKGSILNINATFAGIGSSLGNITIDQTLLQQVNAPFPIYAAGAITIKESRGWITAKTTTVATAYNVLASGANTITIGDGVAVTAGASYAEAVEVAAKDVDWDTCKYLYLTTDYEIKGEEPTWTLGSKEGASITSKADKDLFDCVAVDGVTVDSANYTVVDGSTKITFTPEFLNTLKVGKHTVTIYSKTGAAEGTLTIAAAPVVEEKEEEDVAQTADNTAVATFVALATLSAAGFVTLKKKEN